MLFRAEALGRELKAHERQARLPWPQREIVRRVERAIAARDGEVLSLLMARQTGKNESEGLLEARALSIWRGVPGSTWVRVAPTWKPQIVNSKLRLEKHLKADPLLAGRWVRREGYIYESGEAQIQFLSGGPTANVVGATASIALSVDEAHKIDRGKFEEDLGPFTASTNAPTLLWGVAADELDLLHEYRQRAEGTDRLLVFPADVWCELSAAYAAHYAARVATLGEDHPTILTQYRLIPIAAAGAYLNAVQRASLFNQDDAHPRLEAPREGMLYALVCDVGGESEEERDDAGEMAENPGRDYTMAWVLEVDPRASRHPYPMVRVVNGVWWVGRAHLEALKDLAAYCRHWGIERGVIDARGVGEALAMALQKRVPGILAYKATQADVSADCYDLLARINTGRVRFWKADPSADPELREAQAQARHTRYVIRGHELMALAKPPSHGKHIDGIKALTYLHRAVAGLGVRLATFA
jgi:hypothetical protein